MSRKSTKALIKFTKVDQDGNHLDPDNWMIEIQNRQLVIAKVLKKLAKDHTSQFYIETDLDPKFRFKTMSQLGYIHAGLLPGFREYFEDQGVYLTDDEIKDSIKSNPEVRFLDFVRKVDPFTGEVTQVAKIKSLKFASVEETTQFIEDTIRLADLYGVLYETPDEYKEKHGINEFQ